MARGCALIDSRLDTAKIGSDGRVEVHRARLLAVFGGTKNVSTRPGSKPEKLNESKCFPLFTQQRTSPRYFGMSVSCHERTSGTLPNRAKTRSYGVRGHLAFWGEGVRLRGGECA